MPRPDRGALAAFAHVCGNNFINYDDDVYVTENRHVQAGLTVPSIQWAFTNVDASNWHPLTWLSLQLDYQLFGLAPWGYHLTNLLLHVANGLLLFIVLRRMTGATWRSGLVAVLFTLHPLHVESVAWVAERKDVLSTLFWMLTLWAYVYYTERPKLARYLVVVAAFALGLLAKPMLVTLPCVLLLLDFWPLQRLRSGQATPGRLIWEKVPLFVLAAASCAVTWYAQQHAGAVAALDKLPLKLRLANAVLAYVGYIGKTFWPRDLAIFYPHPLTMGPAWRLVLAAVFLLTVTGLALATSRRRPFVAVGWLWYLGTLVPVIGAVQVGQQAMADRYTYIPLIGLFLLVAWGLPSLLARWQLPASLLALPAVMVVAACTVCTAMQVAVWHDSIALWEHSCKVTPESATARNNLGLALLQEGKFEEAEQNFRRALRINPAYYLSLNNLGLALAAQGKVGEALRWYAEAIRINPHFYHVHNNLGLVLESQGKLPEAVEQYTQAIGMEPGAANVHDNLGNALLKLSRTEEAIVHYREAVALWPDHVCYRYDLACALQEQGLGEVAAAEYQQALRLYPAWPAVANKWACDLVRQEDPWRRDPARALQLAKQACQATGGKRPEFLDTLALAYAETGHWEEAAAVARTALQLASAAQKHQLAHRIESHLTLYQARQTVPH